MDRLKNAQYIALGATALSIIGFSIGGMSESVIGSVLVMLGCLTGIVSYCFGGFGKALSMAGKIAKWGWVVIPFPYDLLTLPLTFLLSIYVFLFLPIIPIRKAYKEQMRGY